MQRVALVAGASYGIGKATIRQMLSEEIQVFAAARRTERMRSLEPAGATLLGLGFANESMRATVEAPKESPGASAI